MARGMGVQSLQTPAHRPDSVPPGAGLWPPRISSPPAASPTTTAPPQCGPRGPPPRLHPRVRGAYLGRSCSASHGASSAQAAGFLPALRVSVPAARTVRGAQPAQGLQGREGAARRPGRTQETRGGKREKKGEKVCHRLEGGGKCKTRQEMRLKKKCKRLENEIRKRGRGGAWVLALEEGGDEVGMGSGSGVRGCGAAGGVGLGLETPRRPPGGPAPAGMRLGPCLGLQPPPALTPEPPTRVQGPARAQERPWEGSPPSRLCRLCPLL